jgi:hypothetical protein
MTTLLLITLAMPGQSDPAADTVAWSSPRYGVALRLPEAWHVVAREVEDRVFVAVLGDDVNWPAVVACELAMAPESLDAYRTRIDANARRGRRPGTLTRNRIETTPRGERLETLREYHPEPEVVRVERSIYIIANRQLYKFLIDADAETYARARAEFEALVDSAAFPAPDTGCDVLDAARNRWVQREFHVALDLPEGWRPALAPSEVALLYATAPPRGVWSDNALVIARPLGDLDPHALARALPEQLRAEEPGCEVLRCEVVKQGDRDALETVVRTRRGPFAMTVIERRFRGDRFTYEVKFTLESDHFDAMAPALRRCLDSFEERPGEVPGVGKPA